MQSFSPDVARGLGGPDWLVARRLAALQTLETTPFPSTEEEIWRYSRIGELDLGRFRPVPGAELDEPGSERAPGGGPWALEAGRHAALLVVRDGRVVHHEIDPALAALGVRVADLATCDDDAEVQAALGSVSDAAPDYFTLLHDAFMPGGALVVVPDGVVVDDPIVVLHWAEGDGEASFPHTLVIAGRNAEVTVLERFGSPDTEHLVDAVSELVLHENASVRYLTSQEHGPRTWHIGLQRAHLARDARLHSAAVALGGDYARLRTEARLDAPGAQSEMVAAYFGSERQMLDFRTLQDHAAPRTRSELLFKGAVEDTATSVYSGMIRLREEAQKSAAFQTNRNLVLTEGASAESIPNLEIFANDVQCSHGSTVGPIDDDQRYYLESRGIPPTDAERLIVLGFFDDIFARLPHAGLVGSLRRSVVDKVERSGSGARR